MIQVYVVTIIGTMYASYVYQDDISAMTRAVWLERFYGKWCEISVMKVWMSFTYAPVDTYEKPHELIYLYQGVGCPDGNCSI